jgi:hypothetical protein
VFSPARADDERLDPPRLRLPLPRRAALIRAAAVAALLCLAAGVLFVDGSAPAAAPAPAASPSPVGTPGPVAPPGTVGLPLRLPDAGVVAVVRAGQRVDVFGASGDGRPAQLLAAGVLVLRATARGEAPEDGALLYLAVTTEQAAHLAGYTTDAHITVTVRSP